MFFGPVQMKRPQVLNDPSKRALPIRTDALNFTSASLARWLKAATRTIRCPSPPGATSCTTSPATSRAAPSCLSKRRPEPLVEVHPDTALTLGLSDGEPARLSTRRAEAIYKVKLSPKIRPDTLFVPIHWEGEQAANRLTLGALDPLSKMPEFKAAAARLEASPSKHKCERARSKNRPTIKILLATQAHTSYLFAPKF